MHLLTPGNVNDIAMTPTLLAEVGGPVRRLLGDKGYDANSLRALLAKQGTSTVIPFTASRKVAIPYDKRAYRKHNLVERMFCRPRTSGLSPPATTSSPATSWLEP